MTFCKVTPLRASGRPPTGPVAQQRVGVVDAHGHQHRLRRRRIPWNEATREGAMMLHRLTHVPCQVAAPQVAARYRKRWTRETAGKHKEGACFNG